MLIVDLSSNNPHPIDHGALRRAGVGGEVIKATESTNYVNEHFGSDYWSAAEAGQHTGAYHFDHWLEDLDAQLSYFRAHYSPRAGDLPPWWDLEDYRDPGGVWRHLGVDLAWPAVIHRAQVALYLLRVAYGEGLLYCNRSVAARLIAGGFNPLTDLCVAQGSAGPVMAARVMQFAPAALPGVGGLTDWSVA